MAKITIEELYRREKYDIMGAVTAKALALGINERTDDGRTWIDMERPPDHYSNAKTE